MYIILGNPFKYFIWFWLGQCLSKYFSNLKIRLDNHLYVCLSIIMFSSFYFLSINVDHLGWLIRDTFCLITLIPTIWIVANRISLSLRLASKKTIKRCLKYSFGIYLYSEPLNYLLLSIIYTYFGVAFFGNELNAILLYIMRILFSFLVPILIVNIFKKNKKIKYLY